MGLVEVLSSIGWDTLNWEVTFVCLFFTKRAEVEPLNVELVATVIRAHKYGEDVLYRDGVDYLCKTLHAWRRAVMGFWSRAHINYCTSS